MTRGLALPPLPMLLGGAARGDVVHLLADLDWLMATCMVRLMMLPVIQ